MISIDSNNFILQKQQMQMRSKRAIKQKQTDIHQQNPHYPYHLELVEVQTNASLIEKLMEFKASKPANYWMRVLGQNAENKIHQEIIDGDITLQQENRVDFKNYINLLNKSIAMKKINESEEYYQMQKDFRIMNGQYQLARKMEEEEANAKNKRSRKQQIQQKNILDDKKSSEDIRKQYMEKVKIWKRQKQLRREKIKSLDNKKSSLQNSLDEKIKKEEFAIQQFLKLEKKKIIENNIKEIQQRRQKRQIILSESVIRSQSVPKFLEYQNKFHKQEKQKQIQRSILLQNRRNSLVLPLEEIKVHEREYINRIKQRLNIQKKKQIKKLELSIEDEKKSFNLIKKRNQDQEKKIEEKIKRIKKFQGKIRMIPTKIDSQKRKLAEIQVDKGRNPKKYIFLSQKALSDEQIYDEFKEFDININSRELGNNYLKEMQSRNKPLKRKSNSLHIIPSTKPDYKNYLPELKEKHGKKSIFQNIEEEPQRNYKNTQQKMQDVKNLINKSQNFEKKVLKNIKQLKKIDRYDDSIKKQSQMDDNYMKSIKAKLTVANINQ